MSQAFASGERAILRALDECLKGPSVATALHTIAERVEARLASDPAASMAWEPVPMTLLASPPAPVASCWIFILRAGAVTGAERHPNSHQRMMSLRGDGDLQVWRDGRWAPTPLTDRPGVPLDQRWVSVPPHTWHQAVVPGPNWVVVSFHTVPDTDLIEERGDPTRASVSRRKTYLGA